MLGNYRVAAQLVASRAILSSTELVSYGVSLMGLNKSTKTTDLTADLRDRIKYGLWLLNVMLQLPFVFAEIRRIREELSHYGRSFSRIELQICYFQSRERLRGNYRCAKLLCLLICVIMLIKIAMNKNNYCTTKKWTHCRLILRDSISEQKTTSVIL
jgi:hypothetical protein